MSASQSSTTATTASSTDSPSKGVKREATNEDLEIVPEPRVKRQRNESLQDITLDDEPERDPTFWYSDGSVVLSVADTLFKLHRSRLASQSTYLQDLFDGAPDEDYDADGQRCPLYVVRMKGLKLFDFSSLLGIVEDPFNNRRNEPGFALSAAIARAAKLLGFDQALSWAVDQLEKTWSNKIADIESGPLEPAQEALELSRIVDIPSIRKRALYELMRMPSFGQTEASSALSVADYKVLTYAREKMAQHWSDVINKSPTGRAECCIKNPSKCSIKKDNAMTRNYRWWAVVHRENLLQHHLLDPLGGYLRLKILLPLEAAKDPAVWCSHCCEAWKKDWTDAQEGLWKDLDEWLELQ